MRATFSAKLHCKTNMTQFSFRTAPEDAGPLFVVLPELRDSISNGESWSLGKTVELIFRGTTMSGSRTTLSYYPNAGYIEFNVNKGNSLHDYVESSYDRDGPDILFDATLSLATSSDGVTTIELVRRT